jgi:glycerophosphoryl diester phosphodiesterase
MRPTWRTRQAPPTGLDSRRSEVGSMWDQVGTVVAGALRDLRRSLRSLAITDLAYKLLAFALLTPGTTLLLHWLISRRGQRVVTDVEIAQFFLTEPVGILALILVAAIVVAIVALESACLMAVGLAASQGSELIPRGALAVGFVLAPNVLRLTAHMVVRVLAALLPFALAGGLAYALLLRSHDINYYLSQHPPEFRVAAAIGGLLAIGLAALLVWAISRWALALPLVLFEQVSPRQALGESARRSEGSRSVVVVVLAAWAATALALLGLTTWIVNILGREVAPRFSGSLGMLLLFLAGLLFLWAALGLLVGIANFSLFSLLITRLYLLVGKPREPRLPPVATTGWRAGAAWRLSRRAALGLAGVAILAAAGAALLAFLATRGSEQVVVIAHRGSSAAAPENTLAAFRLAAEERADFVELDVQESADGVVLVAHDQDLMKVAGVPMKIWETAADQLRTVDVGSFAGAQFAAERLPTLAEALAVCKGRCRVIVELKSYGHNQRLEERVVEIVEAAGMERDCIFMSLDHSMVRRMKELRPAWRSGVLVAKAVGDLTSLHADFLAVEARMASGGFVRRAHRAGQEVYVWTVNDPAWILGALGRGVDGLITDKPALARAVVERRAAMSDAQRLLAALLVRLGERTEALEAEDALRP